MINQYKEHEILHITTQDTVTFTAPSVRVYKEPDTSLVFVHILVHFNALYPKFNIIEGDYGW